MGFLQASFQVGHVGIGVAIAFGFAEAYAVNDGSMVQGVRDDGVFLGEEGLEHTAIGVETSGVENGVFSLEVVGDGCFQFLVDVLRSADEAYGRHAVSAAFHNLLGGGNQPRVVGQSQVVVGTEVQYLFAFYGDGSLLCTLNQSLFLVESGFFYFSNSLAEMVFHFTVHSIFIF